jgi:dTDP-4-dehydrorhamnose reductase
MPSAQSSIFVIGATGYVGVPLMMAAQASNLPTYGTCRTGSPALLQLQLDAPHKFNYDVIKPQDVVILTAAVSSPDICAREHAQAWAVNVTGTSEFIEKVIDRGARVIFFSSDTVYGEQHDAFDESGACNPAGEYAAMKHEVERRFLDSDSFRAIRLSYIFSRYDKFTQYLHGCAARQETAELFHPLYRAIIHRDDVIAGVLALARDWDDFSAKVINFGGPEVLSRIDFAQILTDTALAGLQVRVSEPAGDFFINRPRVIQMNSPALTRLLGRPPLSLRQATTIEFNSKDI